ALIQHKTVLVTLLHIHRRPVRRPRYLHCIQDPLPKRPGRRPTAVRRPDHTARHIPPIHIAERTVHYVPIRPHHMRTRDRLTSLHSPHMPRQVHHGRQRHQPHIADHNLPRHQFHRQCRRHITRRRIPNLITALRHLTRRIPPVQIRRRPVQITPQYLHVRIKDRLPRHVIRHPTLQITGPPV